MPIVRGTELYSYLRKSETTLTADDKVLLGILMEIADGLIKDEVGFQIEQATITDEYHPDRSMYPLRDELVDSAPYDVVGNNVVQYAPYGTNNQVLQARNLPVRSITSLYENPAAWDTNPPQWPAPTLYTEGPDFQVDYREPGISWTGHIFNRRGGWLFSPRQQRTVKLTYVAGFTEGEIRTKFPGARLAYLMTMVKFWNEVRAQAKYLGGALTSESLDSWSRSYDGASAAANLGLQYVLPAGAKRALEPHVRMSKYL